MFLNRSSNRNHHLESRVVPGLTWTVHTSLEEAGPAWSAIQQGGSLRLFQSHAWVSAWWNAIGRQAGVAPRIVVGVCDGLPCLLVPLARGRWFGMHTLGWLGGDWNDYNAPIISGALDVLLTDEDIIRLWREIAQIAGGGCLLELAKQSPTVASGAANPMLHPESSREDNAAYVLDLTSELLPKKLQAGKTFSGLDRKMRKLQREGTITFERLAAGELAEAVISTMLDWKRHSLDRRGATNPFEAPESRSFLCELARDPAGDACIYALCLDGRPIAASLCFQEGRNLVLYQMAYDERYARMSPGGQLLRRMIENAVETGCRTFDFAFGDDAYKTDICDQRIVLTRAIVPLGSLGRIVAPLRRMRLGVRRWAKRNDAVHHAALAINRRLRGIRGALSPAKAQAGRFRPTLSEST